MFLFIDRLYEKSKQNTGTIATKYSSISPSAFVLSSNLNNIITMEPKLPNTKLTKIIKFCAFDSSSKKKLTK